LDLAKKIIFAINNQELLNQIGDNGYKYLTKNWDLEEVGNLYNSFYDKIIFAK
jgi:glycosyltransferase involved in cell wall biosynthesis